MQMTEKMIALRDALIGLEHDATRLVIIEGDLNRIV